MTIGELQPLEHRRVGERGQAGFEPHGGRVRVGDGFVVASGGPGLRASAPDAAQIGGRDQDRNSEAGGLGYPAHHCTGEGVTADGHWCLSAVARAVRCPSLARRADTGLPASGLCRDWVRRRGGRALGMARRRRLWNPQPTPTPLTARSRRVGAGLRSQLGRRRMHRQGAASDRLEWTPWDSRQAGQEG